VGPIGYENALGHEWLTHVLEEKYARTMRIKQALMLAAYIAELASIRHFAASRGRSCTLDARLQYTPPHRLRTRIHPIRVHILQRCASMVIEHAHPPHSVARIYRYLSSVFHCFEIQSSYTETSTTNAFLSSHSHILFTAICTAPLCVRLASRVHVLRYFDFIFEFSDDALERRRAE
jgi:hypothetical protein